MSWEQDILNSSVNINRCVWALNYDLTDPVKAFTSEEERLRYIKIQTKEAIKSLTEAYKTLDNQLIYGTD